MAAIPKSLDRIDYQTLQKEKLPVRYKGYKIKEFLNEGRYGRVYTASKTGDLAPKVIKFDNGRSEIANKNEIRILQRLNQGAPSPFIAHLQDIIDDTHLVFDDAGNNLLLAINKLGDFPSAQIKYIGWQLFQGIHFLYTKGVIHRDLKLDNVVVNSEWKIKIIDYGTATFLGEKGSGQCIGTAGWMAPEILIDPDALVSSDFFSAVILLGMLYLKPIGERNLVMRTHEKLLLKECKGRKELMKIIASIFKEMLYQMDCRPSAEEMQKASEQPYNFLSPEIPDHEHIERWQARISFVGKAREDSPEEIESWIALFTPILKFFSQRASVEQIMELAQKYLRPPETRHALSEVKSSKRKLSQDESEKPKQQKLES